MQNTPYFLALNRIPHVGPRTISKLLTHWPNLQELFKQSTSQLCAAGIKRNLAEAISSYNLDNVTLDLRWAEANNHHLLTWEHPNYPNLLKEIYDPPAVLYAIGALNCLLLPAIAIVGSRNPSITGKETARHFGYELANNGLCIVSGLALGIDAQAHQGCLQANAKTIAVLGAGINCIYPARHHNLAAQITERGLLVSEFPLNSRPHAQHFPQRNRIISGLSLATLVIEAALHSGSLITARLSLEQNRDVMAVPGSILNPQSRGCHYLVQQGAKLITSCQDVLNELGMDQKTKWLAIQQTICNNKNDLIKYIGFELTTIDQLISRSGKDLEKVSCDLAALEIAGIIKAVPGGYMRSV